LKVRKTPYWHTLQKGRALGYRRGKKAGVWIARLEDPSIGSKTGRLEKSIGMTDDQVDGKVIEPNGDTILNFGQAQKAAWEWFGRIVHPDRRIDMEKYTVKDAIDDYMDDYLKRGKSESNTRYVIDCYILPSLGTINVKRLSKKKISDWHFDISKRPPRLRTKRGEKQQFKDTGDDPEANRRRKSTANRVLTVLKAALNFAASEFAIDDTAWANVKPFKEVDAAKMRWLEDDETRRLVNTCQEPLRSLVVAALLTGARYGELARLRVSDHDKDNGTVFVSESKSGKPRHIVLTDEGRQHFQMAAIGKEGNDLLFSRSREGAKWGKSHQTRPVADACERANIFPAIGFHILRHTYASRLVRQGVPLIVVADQLGHRDTRMVEKHYAHLNDEYRKQTIRDAFTNMGLVSEDNVERLNSE
jgi:integrase